MLLGCIVAVLVSLMREFKNGEDALVSISSVRSFLYIKSDDVMRSFENAEIFRNKYYYV